MCSGVYSLELHSHWAVWSSGVAAPELGVERGVLVPLSFLAPSLQNVGIIEECAPEIVLALEFALQSHIRTGPAVSKIPTPFRFCFLFFVFVPRVQCEAERRLYLRRLSSWLMWSCLGMYPLFS